MKEGARVYITGRRQAELDAALLGPSAKAVQGDVSKPADLDRLWQHRGSIYRLSVTDGWAVMESEQAVKRVGPIPL